MPPAGRQQTHISLAQAYVAASNAHDLNAIAPMFAENADYVSARTGSFSGVTDIIAMMKGFFDSNTDSHWVTRDWREIDDNGVEFDFELTTGGSPRPGTERVFFDGAGRIRRIEVVT